MDNQDDNEKEIKKSDSPTERSLDVAKYKDIEEFFSGDSKQTYLYNKTKKIVTASFVISNFLPENDALRMSIRKTAINFLKSALNIKDTDLGAQGAVPNFRKFALELGSFLDVAYYAGFITQMNADILRAEIGKLLSFYKQEFARLDSIDKSFGEDFFGEEWQGSSEKGDVDFAREERFASDRSAEIARQEEGSIKDKSSYKPGMVRDLAGQKEIVSLSPAKDKKLREFSPVAVKHSKRQSIIINFLKRKKQAMVKDFAGIITDCSEKTIQRELSALVEDGVLKKEGERRWTKYSLS